MANEELVNLAREEIEAKSDQFMSRSVGSSWIASALMVQNAMLMEIEAAEQSRHAEANAERITLRAQLTQMESNAQTRHQEAEASRASLLAAIQALGTI